jgi:hypothetical protein
MVDDDPQICVAMLASSDTASKIARADGECRRKIRALARIRATLNLSMMMPGRASNG